MTLETRYISVDGNNIPDVGVGTLEGRIEKAATMRSVPMLSNVFMPIYSEKYDLQWLETTLRKLNTDVYVLAAPKRVFQPNHVARDTRNGDTKNYFLWFAVNGKKEAEGFIKEFGIAQDYDENYRLLKSDVGFAMVAQ